MARPKGEEILRKQKEAKQKKLLLVLVPIFLGLMVWQGPGYVKMLTGGEEPAAAPPAETSTGAVPTTPTPTTPDPSTAPPPTTAAPGGAPAAPSGATPELADSDRPAAADAGQLIAFDRFVGKDPFRQIGDTTPPAASEPPIVTPAPTNPVGPGGGSGTDPGGGNGGGGDDDEPGAPVAAVLAVNGVKEMVRLEGTFPESDKLFVLRRLSRSSAWIGLVAGEFSNGRKSIEVRVGKTLNLVSQPDGIRYTIKVVSIRLGRE
jgi:hypothetical protein